MEKVNTKYIDSLKRQQSYKKEDLKKQAENLIGMMNETATRLEKYLDSDPWVLDSQIQNAVHDIQWQYSMIEKTYDILKETYVCLDAIDQVLKADE